VAKALLEFAGKPVLKHKRRKKKRWRGDRKKRRSKLERERKGVRVMIAHKGENSCIITYEGGRPTKSRKGKSLYKQRQGPDQKKRSTRELIFSKKKTV